MRFRASAAIASFLLLAAIEAPAQPSAAPAPVALRALDAVPAQTDQGPLSRSSEQASDYFGNAAALSGDGTVLAVGSVEDRIDSGSPRTGLVYVFKKQGSTWVQRARLQAADAELGDRFGESVALNFDGTVLIVGAPGDDTAAGAEAGSAYLFTDTNSVWSQAQKLTASDAAAQDFFGSAVQIDDSGTIMAIGAPYDDDPVAGADAGSAYRFAGTAGAAVQAQKILASDRAAQDVFGYSLAMTPGGGTLVVGAPFDDNSGGADAGSAYVFQVSVGSWQQTQRVQATEATQQFGNRAAINETGDTFVTGALNAGVGTSAAYVFALTSATTFLQQAILRSGVDQTGAALSMSGDGGLIASGGPLSAVPEDGGGAVYLFGRAGNGWPTQQRIVRADAAALDYFGTSVALSRAGSALVVGATRTDGFVAFGPGRAYSYVLAPQYVSLKGTKAGGIATTPTAGADANGGPSIANPVTVSGADSTGTVRTLRTNASGEISAVLSSSDVQIGAVEIKNSTTDDRATVAPDGRLATDANLQIGNADAPGGAGAASASTPRTISASDSPDVTALQVIDDWDESDRAKVNLVAGQAGITAGAGAVAASTPRVTLASDDPAVTALQVIDDWDESDRAKVNAIAGQAGVAGGAGTVSANTQRVALATDANSVKVTDGTDTAGVTANSNAVHTALLSGRLLDPNAGELLTVKNARACPSGSGDNDAIAAVTGKKLRVVSVELQARGTVVAVFQDDATATDRGMAWSFQDREGSISAAPAGAFLFETADGVGLDLNLNAAVTTCYNVVYVEVE